jgi:hypothetical protein
LTLLRHEKVACPIAAVIVSNRLEPDSHRGQKPTVKRLGKIYDATAQQALALLNEIFPPSSGGAVTLKTGVSLRRLPFYFCLTVARTSSTNFRKGFTSSY